MADIRATAVDTIRATGMVVDIIRVTGTTADTHQSGSDTGAVDGVVTIIITVGMGDMGTAVEDTGTVITIES